MQTQLSRSTPKRRTFRYVFAGVAVGTLIAWRLARNHLERQRLLRKGEIRELRSMWLDVHGLRIHARASLLPLRRRAGTPVIMVHGLGISSSCLVPTAERLARDFDVYAPDLPGHGLSGTPAEPLDVTGLAQALIDWMDCEGIARAALVGHSLGCQIAVETALSRPERVERLVLIGPTPDPAIRNPLTQFLHLVKDGMYERQSLAGLLAKDYLRMGRRLIPEYRAMMRYPFNRKLGGLSMPTMLVRGEKDTVVTQRWLEQAARLAGTRRTAVIPGWGHAVQYSAPEQLTRTIRPFLASSSPGDLPRMRFQPVTSSASSDY